MATGKLIGVDGSDAGSTNHAPSYIYLTRFQAEATGNDIEIKFKAAAAGNAKVAIYADNSGEPGSLLAYTDSIAVSVGWNTISISSTSLTQGTYYWLAVRISAIGVCVYNNASGTMRYKVLAWDSAWPDPAGSGYTSGSFHSLLAGWGILVLSPSSISQPVGYGSPTVSTSGIVISPQGISVIVSCGMPSLRYPQTMSPSSIVQSVAVGIPSAGIFGIVSPQGISVIVPIGNPTILKYVWHVVLDGQYATETPRINRTYIVGKDQYGNPVYGTAVDSTELGLVGERLDFQQELAIPLAAQAADVASAILSKMRFTKARGVILIPPNCGQELFDVVQISDAGANQAAVSFRVVGIRFEYNPKQARCHHKLILGAP